MEHASPHRFHIPVMGLGFTAETPAKVAHFGISSAVSIMEDHLLERLRGILSLQEQVPFKPIAQNEPDSRARRITAYLDLLHDLVLRKTARLRSLPLAPGSPLTQYFEMLPASAPLRVKYNSIHGALADDRQRIEEELRKLIQPGAIEVNIMTKVDRTNYDVKGTELPPEYSDALSALRGFASSKTPASIVFSAGLNPRLYSYCEKFPDFFPGVDGYQKKKIIIKVSDFRSALVQGKFFAKKGLWVSEFRIESGLNCGGHAFATNGLLLGPILEEFRVRRHDLARELYDICSSALQKKGTRYERMPRQKITAQGGVGTAAENELLISHYGLDSVGWGSPFLLVPEATSVDTATLKELASAEPADYYLSHASPLGVPFNNFRKSSSEKQRLQRIAKKRPGSPCYKKFLAFDREFTEKSICTASREYQRLKLIQAESNGADPVTIAAITEKDWLCEGLGASAVLVHNEIPEHRLTAVAICPGPNLAYFSGVFSLRQMVDHIYGRTSVLNAVPRAHMFINELELYINYLKTEIRKYGKTITARQADHLCDFRSNLLEGIRYYQQLFSAGQLQDFLGRQFPSQLASFRDALSALAVGDVRFNSIVPE